MAHDSHASFAAFVMSLAATAAVHLGDLGDPASGQTHTDVPAAAHMIDLLSMLKEKTAGNLDPDEAQLLEQVIYELQIRYVEVSQGVPDGEAGPGEVAPRPDGPRIIAPDEPRIIIP